MTNPAFELPANELAHQPAPFGEQVPPATEAAPQEAGSPLDHIPPAALFPQAGDRKYNLHNLPILPVIAAPDSETSDPVFEARATFLARDPRIGHIVNSEIARYPSAETHKEQIHADTIIRIAGARHIGLGELKYLSYARVVARNLCVDSLRKSVRRPQTVPLQEDADSEAIPDRAEIAIPGHEDAAIAKSLIESLLANLLPMHREIVILVHFMGMSTREIAKHLGIPEGTVKSRTSSALANMRKMAESKGFTRDMLF